MCQTSVISHHIGHIGRRSFDRRMRMASPMFVEKRGEMSRLLNEVDRLSELGLITIDHEQLSELHNAKVLLRAHGEPPSTYKIARQNNIEIIDATCPVVLKLQRRIHEAYNADHASDVQIVIFGKNGHAEVLGLVGQTEGKPS